MLISLGFFDWSGHIDAFRSIVGEVCGSANPVRGSANSPCVCDPRGTPSEDVRPLLFNIKVS